MNTERCICWDEPGTPDCPVCSNLSSDPVEQIFKEVAAMSPAPPKDEDPYQSEEYQKFVESMAEHCRCRPQNRPCDGVLSGGVCDGIVDEPQRALLFERIEDED